MEATRPGGASEEAAGCGIQEQHLSSNLSEGEAVQSSPRLLTGQERDPAEFTQRHYRPHTKRENAVERLFRARPALPLLKPVSGEDEGKSSLASQTPHFPQEKMHGGVHLNFPTGKAFHQLHSLGRSVCLVRKKKSSCRVMMEISE